MNQLTTNFISKNLRTDSSFAAHVKLGLEAEQPFLSSRYIYDERGSKLFQKIMHLKEYYLTRAETEILTDNANDICQAFTSSNKRVELLELGAGDGKKTKILLAELLRRGEKFTYRPIDISADILEELGNDLLDRFPDIDFQPLVGTYQETLNQLKPEEEVKRVVLFLGSNIGNFAYPQAEAFVQKLTSSLSHGDQLFLGVDLRKNPRQIIDAYDDATGVTAAFNLNLLHRLQNELGAELDLKSWGFYPSYDPTTGEVRSYLYPKGEQRIYIPILEIDRVFREDEVIHTEISKKYSFSELETLATSCHVTSTITFTDAKGYFADLLWDIGGGSN